MKTSELKKIVYNFTKEKLNQKFPDIFPLNEKKATNKIFWSYNKSEGPKKPTVELSDIYKSRLYKRFNPYRKNGKEYTPASWRQTIKFEVKTAASEGNLIEAENLAINIIEYIERLFTNTQETFDYFHSKEIVINELEISQIRDLTKFAYTNNVYVFSIDIPFDYEDIEITEPEKGQCVQVDIKIDNTDKHIEMEL